MSLCIRYVSSPRSNLEFASKSFATNKNARMALIAASKVVQSLNKDCNLSPCSCSDVALLPSGVYQGKVP